MRKGNSIYKINSKLNIIETEIPGSSEMSNYVYVQKLMTLAIFAKQVSHKG